MFKVAYICSTLIRRGPINVLYNLLHELYNYEKKEFEAIIITLSDEEKDSRIQEFKELGIEVISLHLTRSFFSIMNLSRLKRELDREKPDICHSFGFRSDLFCSLLPSNWKKISSIFNYPYEDFCMLYGNFKGHLMAWCNINRWDKFDITIVCSEFILEKLDENTSFPKELIYTGVDPDFFKPCSIKEKSALRERYGIDMDTTVYTYIANMIPRKNPQTLIKAFSKFIHLTKRKVHLLIMGDGELMTECKLLLDNANVTYLGYQDNTKKNLQISDFYISPSLSEGFPTAVLEALSVGVPCILSDIQPHKEMIYGLDQKMLFAPTSIERLVELLQYSLLLNLEITKINCRNYLCSNFSSQVMLKKHIELYKKILHK